MLRGKLRYFSLQCFNMSLEKKAFEVKREFPLCSLVKMMGVFLGFA
jgi:hypothetical protein